MLPDYIVRMALHGGLEDYLVVRDWLEERAVRPEELGLTEAAEQVFKVPYITSNSYLVRGKDCIYIIVNIMGLIEGVAMSPREWVSEKAPEGRLRLDLVELFRSPTTNTPYKRVRVRKAAYPAEARAWLVEWQDEVKKAKKSRDNRE